MFMCRPPPMSIGPFGRSGRVVGAADGVDTPQPAIATAAAASSQDRAIRLHRAIGVIHAPRRVGSLHGARPRPSRAERSFIHELFIDERISRGREVSDAGR